MNLFRKTKASGALKDKHKVHLQVEQLDERLVPTVTASVTNAGVLVVTGDALSNHIRIERPGFGGFGSFEVYSNGHRINIEFQGRYFSSMDADSVEVYGLDGNDTIETGSLSGFGGNVLMSGGAGNDLLSMANAGWYHESTLNGGVGSDILVGGYKTDHLNGNSGRDVLIGGAGADVLHGGTGQDLLIAGYTDYDQDAVELSLLRSYWSRGLDSAYNQRVDGIRFGSNGFAGSRWNSATVHTDSQHDDLYGDDGLDCFYRHFSQDTIHDLVAGERIVSI